MGYLKQVVLLSDAVEAEICGVFYRQDMSDTFPCVEGTTENP